MASETVDRPLEDAVTWLASTLTGSTATSIAVLAIAALGVSMLAGITPVRRAMAVITGCFILFSAGLIASALVNIARPARPALAAAPSDALPYSPKVAQPVPYDPYAGASVPNRRETPIVQ